MRWGKLFLVLTVTGGIVGFNLGFKNLLIKRLIESTLQSIFQAKAEVRGVRFELLGIRLKWDHLEVANADAPMKNLFELGKTEFKMNGEELLKGKVVIQNLECQGIAWDTPRKTSGALPHLKNAGTKKSEQDQEEGPGIMEIAKVNAQELLQKHLAELKTLSTLSNINREYTAFGDKWEKQVLDTQKNVSNLNAGYKTLKAVNVPAIKTLDQAQKTLTEIQKFNQSLQKVRQDVDTVSKQAAGDIKKVQALAQDSRSALQSDLSYLKGLINIPEGGAQGLIKTMVQKTLAEQLGASYYYAMQAWGYAQAINQSSPKDAKEQKKRMKAASLRRPGHEVYFPGTGYPDFLLQHLGTSISNQAEGKYLQVDINDVSSDPNLWNKPLTWLIDRRDQAMGLRLTGAIDTRTNSNLAFRMDLSLREIPFQVGDELSFMNIRSASGRYTLALGLDLRKDKSNSGRLDLALSGMQWVKGDNPGTVSDILYDILAETPLIRFNINYRVVQPGGSLELEVRSSLDDIIRRKIGKFIDDMVKEAEAKLSAELNRLAAPLLKEKDKLQLRVDGVQDSLSSSVRQVTEYQKEIDKKKAEVDARIEQIKKETGSKVTDTIKKNVTLPKF